MWPFIHHRSVLSSGRLVRRALIPEKDPDQGSSPLHSLAVTGHVHLRVERVVQHLRSKQVVLQVAPQLRKLKQFPLIKYGPSGREERVHLVE